MGATSARAGAAGAAAGAAASATASAGDDGDTDMGGAASGSSQRPGQGQGPPLTDAQRAEDAAVWATMAEAAHLPPPRLPNRDDGSEGDATRKEQRGSCAVM